MILFSLFVYGLIEVPFNTSSSLFAQNKFLEKSYDIIKHNINSNFHPKENLQELKFLFLISNLTSKPS